MHRAYKPTIFLLVLLFSWLGLNLRPWISKGMVWIETTRLTQKALRLPIEFQNPAPNQDLIAGKFSREFWKFGIVSRDGRTFNPPAAREASILFRRNFASQTPSAKSQNIPMWAAHKDKVRSTALIGRLAFRPTPDEDVILKITSRVQDDFHGLAGAAFQLENTFGPDGSLKKPTDMFGITIQGKESNSQKAGSVTCFLTLGGIPVQVKDIESDVSIWHEYGIRLRWINRTSWHGIVSVDGNEVCDMPLPAFGPVEVKVWMENASSMTRLRRWREIALFMNIEPRNNRASLFEMQSIKLYAEAR